MLKVASEMAEGGIQVRVLRGGSRFSRLIGAVAVLAGAVVGILVPLGALTAEPAFAAFNACMDSTIAQPTAVHQLPSESSRTVQFLSAGSAVNESYCEFFNNLGEAHWYMTVRTTNGSNGGVGYIWVQRLYWGHYHLCALSDMDVATIGSWECPLVNYS